MESSRIFKKYEKSYNENEIYDLLVISMRAVQLYRFIFL